MISVETESAGRLTSRQESLRELEKTRAVGTGCSRQLALTGVSGPARRRVEKLPETTVNATIRINAKFLWATGRGNSRTIQMHPVEVEWATYV